MKVKQDAISNYYLAIYTERFRESILKKTNPTKTQNNKKYAEPNLQKNGLKRMTMMFCCTRDRK